MHTIEFGMVLASLRSPPIPRLVLPCGSHVALEGEFNDKQVGEMS
jgi:hypothetical protein